MDLNFVLEKIKELSMLTGGRTGCSWSIPPLSVIRLGVRTTDVFRDPLDGGKTANFAAGGPCRLMVTTAAVLPEESMANA